jgi:hypothetical protein
MHCFDVDNELYIIFRLGRSSVFLCWFQKWAPLIRHLEFTTKFPCLLSHMNHPSYAIKQGSFMNWLTLDEHWACPVDSSNGWQLRKRNGPKEFCCYYHQACFQQNWLLSCIVRGTIQYWNFVGIDNKQLTSPWPSISCFSRPTGCGLIAGKQKWHHQQVIYRGGLQTRNTYVDWNWFRSVS